MTLDEFLNVVVADCVNARWYPPVEDDEAEQSDTDEVSESDESGATE